jgi:hypothetical protein
VLGEERHDEISARLEYSPRKSLRNLVQETTVSSLLFLKKQLQCVNVHIFYDARNTCITSESISGAAVI